MGTVMAAGKGLTGKYGEWLARRYIKRLGYKLISHNYKTPAGEIDIIAKQDSQYVFIEVKTRRSTAYGRPFEAVDTNKRQRILKSALFYIKGLKEVPSVRFDVISISLYGPRCEIEHIRDVLEL